MSKWELIPRGQYAPLRETVGKAEGTPIGDVEYDLSMTDGAIVMSVDGRYFVLRARDLMNDFIEFYQTEGPVADRGGQMIR